MLFKLKTDTKSVYMKKVLPLLIFTLLGTYHFNVFATEQDFQLHGFLAQGLIDVNGSNFVNDDGELSTELTELGINGSYQINSNFRVAGQVVYLDGGNRYEKGVRVDYALLDWSVLDDASWQANIYLGRFKNNHWLYSSSRDVPFARPSIILPQSVYFDGFRDIAVGSDGVATKISHSDDELGDFDFNLSYGTSPTSAMQQDIILSKLAQGKAKQDSDLQASLYWQPAFSPWRFGISLLKSDFSYQANNTFDLFSDGDFSFQFYTINALYEGETWEFSGEVYQVRFDTQGFYNPTYSEAPIGQGAYLQSRYKLTSELTFLARYEHFYLNKGDKDGEQLVEDTQGVIPAYFAFHDDITLAASYEFSSNLMLRVEYHWVKGAGRLTPVILPNPVANSNEHWQMWAMQLMYWF